MTWVDVTNGYAPDKTFPARDREARPALYAGQNLPWPRCGNTKFYAMNRSVPPPALRVNAAFHKNGSMVCWLRFHNPGYAMQLL
ncbi:hypothetical protein DCC81_04190 [Chitinophaga parva]|uniref:Uncharacterized protein n=1 Tax=Chitinophaga parva TaxID=2169414 RepID=A0A2T7BM43_9BACT|nr:hypothetical protein DCC81_04190 [Chitinophaga parva]